jgi:FKBP-type peptidyl-prolyl cis-trans isomerase FkpA
VTIDYTGQLINDYVFDSADGAVMQVSSVVAGFAEGLKKMNQFGEYEFYIPYYLGYGSAGTGSEGTESFIPPYSTLRFRVYLHSVN